MEPAGNNTVINSVEDTGSTYNLYETQRQVYQGSVNSTACSATVTTNCLLLTTTACYNGHYSSCGTLQVASPISQPDRYSQAGGGSIRLSEVTYNASDLVTDDKEYNYGVSLNAAPPTTYLVRETSTTYGSYNQLPWTTGGTTVEAGTIDGTDQNGNLYFSGGFTSAITMNSTPWGLFMNPNLVYEVFTGTGTGYSNSTFQAIELGHELAHGSILYGAPPSPGLRSGRRGEMGLLA